MAVSARASVINGMGTRLLRLLPPETSHNIAKKAMRRRLGAPGLLEQYEPGGDAPKSKPKLFGVVVPNRLGLAAGFDKNAELVDVASVYGFGWVEVGSVTFHGGRGNPGKRVFRVNRHDIANRMGLNGLPAAVVATRLDNCRSGLYAVNIAKTHNPEITGDAAIRDMAMSYHILKGRGIYTVLNLSCPNTKEGKTFEAPEPLCDLLMGIKEVRASTTPLLVKVSPTIGLYDLEQLVAVAEANGVDGYVATNTMPRYVVEARNNCGCSGSFVRDAAVATVRALRSLTKKPIIGCGGISTPADVARMRRAGADFVQAYNGFVRGPYSGPDFAHRVMREN